MSLLHSWNCRGITLSVIVVTAALDMMIAIGSALALILVVQRFVSRRKSLLSRLLDARPSVDAAGEGFVTLRGELEADAPCARFDDGEKAIAAQIARGEAPLIETQGSGLRLLVGLKHEQLQVVELEGKVEMLGDFRLGGFRTYSRALRYPPDESVLWRALKVEPNALELLDRVNRPVFRSVGLGAEVEVTGHLSQQAATNGLAGYRQLAQRWVMRPANNGALLLADSAKHRRTSRRPRRAALALAGVLAALVVVRTSMISWSVVRTHSHRTAVEQVVEWAHGTNQQHCRRSFDCRAFGHCSAERPVLSDVIQGAAARCLAATDRDCQSSQNCRIHGLCWADGGWCAPQR